MAVLMSSRPPWGHGVASVDRQVDDHLLDLPGIGHHFQVTSR